MSTCIAHECDDAYVQRSIHADGNSTFAQRTGGDAEAVNRDAVALLYPALGQTVVAAPRTVPVDFRVLPLSVIEVNLEGALGARRRILASPVTAFVLVLAGDFLVLITLVSLYGLLERVHTTGRQRLYSLMS